jgi:hypothetical protein
LVEFHQTKVWLQPRDGFFGSDAIRARCFAEHHDLVGFDGSFGNFFWGGWEDWKGSFLGLFVRIDEGQRCPQGRHNGEQRNVPSKTHFPIFQCFVPAFCPQVVGTGNAEFLAIDCVDQASILFPQRKNLLDLITEPGKAGRRHQHQPVSAIQREDGTKLVAQQA